jgi:multiple antibiotic resistance protein
MKTTLHIADLQEGFTFMKNELQAVATLFSLINPVMCATLFAKVVEGKSRQVQILAATKTVLVIMVVLLLAAFFGSQLLHVFGVSLEAFSVAGGGVLAWIGFAMLSGRGSVSTPKSQTQTSEANQTTPSLAPVILFAASPGTITGVITISASHSKLDVPVTAILAIVAVLALTWIVLVLTTRFDGSKKTNGMIQDMTTRYMGVIVIAMGIQFALTGLKSFMAIG